MKITKETKHELLMDNNWILCGWEEISQRKDFSKLYWRNISTTQNNHKITSYCLGHYPHRLDGPSYNLLDENGKIIHCEWWVHGYELPGFDKYYRPDNLMPGLIKYLREYPEDIEQIEKIAIYNNLSDDQILLIKTAHLFV